MPPPKKKGHPTTSVRYLISVYNEKLQKIYIDVLAIDIGVICAKNGWYSIINKKLEQFSWDMIFIAEYMNITRNCWKSNSDLKLHNFDDQL